MKVSVNNGKIDQSVFLLQKDDKYMIKEVIHMLSDMILDKSDCRDIIIPLNGARASLERVYKLLEKK